MNIENQPTRVLFQERQILRSRDLTDEQAYHLEMRRRHNLALHTWGIAYGLTLQASEGNEVSVLPGIAIDGFGREVVVAQQIKLSNLDPKINTGPFDIWVRYGLTDSSNEAKNGVGSARPADRLRVEKPTIYFKLTAERQAPETNVSPERPPPDDPDQDWPILLGKVEWRASADKAGGLPAWQIDMSERRYAGLVAEQIVSPARPVQNAKSTLIQNGSAPGLALYPFAVYVWDAAKKPSPDEAEAALAIDNDHNLALNANTLTLGGDLVLDNGAAMEFQHNSIAASDAETKAKAIPGQPWRIYHYFKPADIPPSLPATVPTSADGYANELRISMAGTPAGANSIKIGHWTGKGLFKPVLTINDKGDVTVDGNLVVTGVLDARQVQAPLADVGGGAAGHPSDPGEDILDRIAAFVNINDNDTNLQKVLGRLLKTTNGPSRVATKLLADGAFQNSFTTDGLKSSLAKLALEKALAEVIAQTVNDQKGREGLIQHVLLPADKNLLNQTFVNNRQPLLDEVVKQLSNNQLELITVEQAVQAYVKVLVQADGTTNASSGARGRAVAAALFDTFPSGTLAVGTHEAGMDSLAWTLREDLEAAEAAATLPDNLPPGEPLPGDLPNLDAFLPSVSRLARFVEFLQAKHPQLCAVLRLLLAQS